MSAYAAQRVLHWLLAGGAQNRDGVLAPSLKRIVPRIDFAAISAFIDDTPYLTDLQRQFYKTYLAARYEVMFGSLY